MFLKNVQCWGFTERLLTRQARTQEQMTKAKGEKAEGGKNTQSDVDTGLLRQKFPKT